MKWYFEFPLWWLIIFIIFFLVTPYKQEDLGMGLFVSFFMSLIFSYAAYAGYHEIRKKQKK